MEQTFGQVMRRFPLIGSRMRISLQNVPTVVAACLVLHNCAKFLKDFDDFGSFMAGENHSVFQTAPSAATLQAEAAARTTWVNGNTNGLLRQIKVNGQLKQERLAVQIYQQFDRNLNRVYL